MKNKEILIKANKTVAAGDYDGFLMFCTEDTKWTFVGDAILEGKKAVLDWMTANYIEPPIFGVKKLIAENDFVTVTGDIKIATINGEAKNYAYCDIWRFHEGKMAELMAFVIESEE